MGRGITPIWIASHSACLKENGNEVELFDATFYENWTFNETSYNKQYRPTDYLNVISFSKEDVIEDFIKKCNSYKPDIIFWFAISSPIHGEGEYVNIQYGYEIAKHYLKSKTILLTGGLQATAVPKKI
jgi:anaerobic magnesium-protoporphyrin IX monomethyl ester cyclase